MQSFSELVTREPLGVVRSWLCHLRMECIVIRNWLVQKREYKTEIVLYGKNIWISSVHCSLEFLFSYSSLYLSLSLSILEVNCPRIQLVLRRFLSFREVVGDSFLCVCSKNSFRKSIEDALNYLKKKKKKSLFKCCHSGKKKINPKKLIYF